MSGEGGRPLAMIVSRFPTVSETFVLFEIVELRRLGVRVELFPLIHEHPGVVHPEAAALDREAHHMRLASREVLGAQLHWLRRAPRRYLRIWWEAVRGNLRSPGFLARTLYVIPKAAAFARRMEQLGVEHIHAHFATHPTLAAWAASELSGIPYSFTAHAHDLYVDRSMLGEKLRRASFARTISEHNRRLLERLYGPEASARTHVIHCGVDVKAFEGRGPDRDGPEFTIVCVASMKEYKGHRYLLEALAAMAASGQRFRCLLVGDGELRPEIVRRVAQPDLADSVTVCGDLPAERVRTLLAGADAAVLASVVEETGKMEGIPVFLMEAMAAGLPVVATQISGIAELVEDGVSGLLVPERDPAALAAALSRIAGDPELRRRFGRAGHDRVRDSFELTRTVAALRDLLLAPPKGRG